MRVNFNKTNYGIKQKILLKDVKCKCIRLSVKKSEPFEYKGTDRSPHTPTY